MMVDTEAIKHGLRSLAGALDWRFAVYDNNEALMAFKTWLVEQLELVGFGFFESANNHRDVSTALWWAGPRTDFQERVLDEARTRGIKATIYAAKYSQDALDRACRLIFEASEALASVNFAIASVSAFDAKHDGLTVQGFDPSHPARLLGDSTRTAVRAVLRGIDGLVEVMHLCDILIEHGEQPVLL